MDELEETRDRALIMTGFAGGFNRAELAALKASDLRETSEGYEIRIPQISRRERRISSKESKRFADMLYKIVRDWVRSDEEFSAILRNREENLKRRAAGQSVILRRLTSNWP